MAGNTSAATRPSRRGQLSLSEISNRFLLRPVRPPGSPAPLPGVKSGTGQPPLRAAAPRGPPVWPRHPDGGDRSAGESVLAPHGMTASSAAAAVHDSGGGQLAGGTDHARSAAGRLRHRRGPVSPAAEVPGGAHPGHRRGKGAVPPHAGEVLPPLQRPLQPLPQPRGGQAVGRDRQQLHRRLLERGAGHAHHLRAAGGVLPAVRPAGRAAGPRGRRTGVRAGRVALLHLLGGLGAAGALAPADGGGGRGLGGQDGREGGAAPALHRATVQSRADPRGLAPGAGAARLRADADVTGTAGLGAAIPGAAAAAVPRQSADGLQNPRVPRRSAAARAALLGKAGKL